MIAGIITAVIGSQGVWAFVKWLIERRRKTVHRDELAKCVEQALSSSPTIHGINEKLDRDLLRFDADNKRLDSQSEQLKSIKLIVLRQCLFASPHDRNAHESALEYGKEYIDEGGNGPGHIRYNQLSDDYRRRLEADDWDYSPCHRNV